PVAGVGVEAVRGGRREPGDRGGQGVAVHRLDELPLLVDVVGGDADVVARGLPGQGGRGGGDSGGAQAGGAGRGLGVRHATAAVDLELGERVTPAAGAGGVDAYEPAEPRDVKGLDPAPAGGGGDDRAPPHALGGRLYLVGPPTRRRPAQ